MSRIQQDFFHLIVFVLSLHTVYDSTGKMVSGMLLGALVQHGNYDECINIHRYPELDLESQEHEPHYCSAFFSTPTWIFTFVQSLVMSSHDHLLGHLPFAKNKYCIE